VSDDDPGVVVCLMGGLGNQFFQLAAGRTVAKERGRQLYVFEKSKVGVTDFVQFDLPLATKRMVDQLLLDGCNRTSSFGMWLWEVRAPWLRRDPRFFTFRSEDAYDGREDPRLFGHRGLLGMFGWFQHQRWYEPVLSEILDALRRSIASVVRPEERTFSEELGDFTVVSLRRGDYVRHGFELPIGYYESALDTLPKTEGSLVLLSDDDLVTETAGPWFKAKGFDVIPESVLGDRSRHRDLALLADASQVVMSNSTFCWWGTVLGDESDERENRARFVVAPRDWITEYPTSHTLLRPRWLAV